MIHESLQRHVIREDRLCGLGGTAIGASSVRGRWV